MRKILFYIIPLIIINSIYAQNNSNTLNSLAQTKLDQVSTERSNGNQQANSVNSLPEQDLSGAIPVCQNSYTVSNSYLGAGLISEINNVNTCMGAGEKNSVWYSFNCNTIGRLKFTITPNNLIDDYDFVLYDITGYSFVDTINILPLRCNFTATGGKTGLDSSGTSNNVGAAGSNYNPLLNLIQGHSYVLNISNFSNSTFGYSLNFTGTTADIFGGVNSQIQSVVSYCGADSITVNLSKPILNSSIASNGSDFILSGTGSAINVISAYGKGNTTSTKIILKLNNSISGAGPYTLTLNNGSDGNTLLNSCDNSLVSSSTFTFGNSFMLTSVSACQNQTFTVSAAPANSYTWTGALVPPAEINNQSLSVTSATSGNFTFTLETTDNCGTNTNTISAIINPLPNTVITSSATSACPGTGLYLYSSGATNYLWSVINPTYEATPPLNYTLSSFKANPMQDNVYKVIGTNSYGCSSAAFYTVTVLVSPTVAILGTDTICYGTSAVLNYSGSANTYTWTTNNFVTTPTIAVNAPTISIAPTTITNYSLTGTNTTNGCMAQATKQIVVIGTASITPNKTWICAGDSAMLSVTGASSYTWSNGVVSLPIIVKPLSSTTYSVQYENIASCGIRQSTITIASYTVPYLSIISPTNVICYGGPGTFSVTSSSPGSMATMPYSWSNGYLGNTSIVWTSQSPLGYTNSLSVSGYSYPGSCLISTSLVYTVNPLPKIITSLSSGLCIGDTSLLSASGASTYTWNPGNIINPSMVVSPSVTTNYTVSAKDLIGCKNTQTLTVAKSATTTVSATSNPSVVCVGKTATLTATGNGLIKWYSSDTTSQTIGTGLAYITPTLSVGTYTYFVASTCSGYNNRTPVILNVSANPIITASSSSPTVCINTTFQLIGSGATTYTWTTLSPISTVSNPNSVTQTGSRNYSVNGADINGCIGTNTVFVAAYPTSNVTVTANPANVCLGSQSTVSLIGATSYTWSNGVASNSTVITPTVSGYYPVNYLTPSGCIQTYSLYLWVINPSVYINGVSSSTLCSETTATLNAGGAVTYTWSNGSTSTNILITPTVSPNSNVIVTYSLTGTNSNGCLSSATKTINVYGLPNVIITPTKDTVCMGTATTMTASGALSYTWSNNSTNNTYYPGAIIVPTTYSVMGTNSYGCKQSSIKNIGIYSIIQVTAVANPTATCAGQSVSLTAVGVPSYTYSIFGSANPILVKPGTSTTYSVTGKDIHGCLSNHTVAVNVDRSALFNLSLLNYSLCAGSPAYLSVSNGTISYVWSPSVTVSSSTLVTCSPTINTTYSVTGTSQACSWTSTINVSVVQIPTVTIVPNNTITCTTPTIQIFATASGSVSYQWSRFYNNVYYIQSSTTPTVNVTVPGTYYCQVNNTVTGCSATSTCLVNSDFSNYITLTPSFSICTGQFGTLIANGGTGLYNWGTGGLWGGPGSMGSNASSITVTPTATTIYSVSGVGSNGCYGSASVQVSVTAGPSLFFAPTNSVCEGSSISVTANGADTYSWSTGANTASINVTPSVTTIYSVSGSDLNNCSTTQTVSVTVDNSCQDVWPGDANSDGIANNLDVLELGLHYTQTGAPRAATNNNWQSYFTYNWIGTISNGKNLNHSDCNGDGTINDDDTLAIYNNYSLTHTFKPTQTNTVNPQITIVPDQAMVTKGTWGTASVYLGDATTNINNINGVAFTVDFDNTLIEPNSIYVEYQNSFLDASQNLHFRKLDFANGKMFTATTHTVNNNVSGFGKIATLHYQILSSLVTDEVLNIGLIQANQSDASGLITPLTTGAGTLMAVGSSVGIKEVLNSGHVFISPNPTTGVLNIAFSTIPQNTLVEVYNSIGALVLTETLNNKNNTINTSQLSNGMYLIKVLENNRITTVQKIVKQ